MQPGGRGSGRGARFKRDDLSAVVDPDAHAFANMPFDGLRAGCRLADEFIDRRGRWRWLVAGVAIADRPPFR
jgi:hypothetical protein